MNPNAAASATARAHAGRMLIGGQWVDGERTFPVRNKVTGEVLCEAAAASRAQVAEAVAAAAGSFARHALAPYERYEILHRAAASIAARRAELLGTIVAETGFTISDAGGEVDRCIQTLLVSGEEAKRVHGHMVPIDGAPGQSHRLAWTLRVPRGVVVAITPFNSPLNTVAHKVAPAIAAGNTVVLKPASTTPLSAALLCDVLLDSGLPEAHLNLVQGGGAEVGRWLTEEEDVAFYTFTGSTGVGRRIHAAIGLRRSALELGSISSTIVCEDADLDWAMPRCVNASFRKAGQVCTSVQRLYVQRPIVERFTDGLLARTRAAKVGDPYDPATLVGPMIDEREAVRAEEWVRAAAAAGAEVAVGGGRRGAVLEPTVLRRVRPDMRVMCEEIFAPVISIVEFDSFEDTLDQVNATPYGLAAGVFTRDIDRALHATRRLRVGSVHVNETSSSRVDLMPYGGVKESGFGREGPRYAIEEMTEERLVTISATDARRQP